MPRTPRRLPEEYCRRYFRRRLYVVGRCARASRHDELPQLRADFSAHYDDDAHQPMPRASNTFAHHLLPLRPVSRFYSMPTTARALAYLFHEGRRDRYFGIIMRSS